MADWYHQWKGEILGPMAFEELQQKADKGEIEEETLVREGMQGRWVAASQVEGLFVVPGADGELPEEESEVGATEGAAPSAAAAMPEEAHEVRRSPLTMRPCADCGRMVSQKASMCPFCGRSFHESALTIPYRGEHPVPVWVFFALLAVLFILASPVIVHRATSQLVSSAVASEADADRIALLVAGIYVVSMVSCAALGGAIGAPRMAYYTGLLLGLFFGPLGVFAAFAIDKRPQCPNCYSRLVGLARECPYCHAHLTWAMGLRWY